MAKSEITGISVRLFELLEPLEPAMRKRAIKAALTMLGEEDTEVEPEKPKKKTEEASGGDSNLPTNAKTWMRANGITAEHLGHVFHIEGGTAAIIASEAPGKNGKEKTINAYVLTGIAALLGTGEAKFDDKAGRASCDHFGCYQGSNHATIMKNKGNVLSGTKDSGWTVTGPGLKAGAALIKGLSPE
jgi:hypothetical protein